MIRQFVSDALDAVVLGIFRRAKYHQQLGNDYLNYAEDTLPQVMGRLGSEYGAFLESQLKLYKNFAYLQIQGQTLLIDMDIIGVDVEAEKEKANKAALATGLLWFSIKLLDNIIDETNLREDGLVNFLSDTQNAWLSGNEVNGDSEKELVINATTGLLHSGYVGDPSGYMPALDALCRAELGFIYALPGDKVRCAKQVGRTSAELTIKLVEQYMPGYPYRCGSFLIEQGITGKLFDDFKDRHVDREQGNGYAAKEMRKIPAQGLNHFYRHFKALPTFRAKWRNLNFIVLASLFHAKELLKTKEKS